MAVGLAFLEALCVVDLRVFVIPLVFLSADDIPVIEETSYLVTGLVDAATANVRSARHD